MDDLKITDLLDLGVMQKIQDYFSKYTQMASIMADENGRPITRPSRFTVFCNELVRQTKLGCARCVECDHMGAVHTMESGKALTYTCHSGLVDFAAPILVEGRFIGSFIGGQVRIEDIDEERFRREAEEIGVDPLEFIDAARKVPVIERARIDAAAEFLFELSQVISQMAYNNYIALKNSRQQEQTARMQTEYIVKLCDNLKIRIGGWIDKAMEAEDPEHDGLSLAKILQTEGEDVLVNIDDTLEYIKAAGGKIQLQESEYHVRELFRGIISTVSRQEELKKDLQIELLVGDEVPNQIFGDSGHMGQVIYILLQNSIRYSEKGVIQIRVSSKRISYSTWLFITIQDPGQGIPARKMQMLREYFSSDYQGMLDDIVGTKIGLAQVGYFVRQMYGKIEIESLEGKGTKIEIRIPQLDLAGE